MAVVLVEIGHYSLDDPETGQTFRNMALPIFGAICLSRFVELKPGSPTIPF